MHHRGLHMERLPLHLGGSRYNTQQGEQLQSEHLEHLQALLLHVQVNLQVTSCRLIVSLCGRRAVMVGVREEPSECPGAEKTVSLVVGQSK